MSSNERFSNNITTMSGYGVQSNYANVENTGDNSVAHRRHKSKGALTNFGFTSKPALSNITTPHSEFAISTPHIEFKEVKKPDPKRGN